MKTEVIKQSAEVKAKKIKGSDGKGRTLGSKSYVEISLKTLTEQLGGNQNVIVPVSRVFLVKRQMDAARAMIDSLETKNTPATVAA